jgi:transposase
MGQRQLAILVGFADDCSEDVRRHLYRCLHRGGRIAHDDWTHPHDPDAKITKMKDGRTHLAHKAEHAVDLETGAIVDVTVQNADDGDVASSVETLITAAEQIEAVLPEGDGLQEVVGDKGYHSNQSLVDLEAWVSGATSRNLIAGDATGRRSLRHVPRCIAIGDAFVARGGLRLLRLRDESLERPFAHLYETGGMRRVHLRGHTNVLKRLLIHTGGFNLGLLMRQMIGVGTPRSLQGRLNAVVAALLALLESLSELARPLRRPVRQVSPLERRSIGRLGAVHIGVREMVFTTGC